MSDQRLTINNHDSIRREMLAGIVREHDFDEIDEAMAIPDPPQKRSEREVSQVLRILDELERGRR
jgi:hypothetical protein